MAGQNCKTYRNLTLPTKSSNKISYPFEISPYDSSFGGKPPKNQDEKKTFYMVKTGDCFRSFDYSQKNQVPIKGIYDAFELAAGSKVFIDFTISEDLQVSGDATIKCEPVGKNSPGKDDKYTEDPNGWVDYPLMFRIIPKEENEVKNGFLNVGMEGKRQTKAYLLLGVRSDDDNIDGEKNKTSASNPTGDFFVVQKANSNIIMMASQYRGVPVCFPMPWWGSAHPSGAVVGSSAIN